MPGNTPGVGQLFEARLAGLGGVPFGADQTIWAFARTSRKRFAFWVNFLKHDIENHEHEPTWAPIVHFGEGLRMKIGAEWKHAGLKHQHLDSFKQLIHEPLGHIRLDPEKGRGDTSFSA